MIYNYGLLWRRDLIFWGKGGKGDNPAHLKGMKTRSKKQMPSLSRKTVDFRCQIGVYVLYYDFELVYVGQVGAKAEKGEEGTNFYTRLNQHKADFLADRWNRFSWFGIRKVIQKPGRKQDKILGSIPDGVQSTRADFFNTLEAVMISISEPKLNRQSGTWKKPAEEYFQWWNKTQLDGQEGSDKYAARL